MSKKDYEMIAKTLAKVYDEKTWRIALELADVFEKENQRFDRNKFLKMCKG